MNFLIYAVVESEKPEGNRKELLQEPHGELGLSAGVLLVFRRPLEESCTYLQMVFLLLVKSSKWTLSLHVRSFEYRNIHLNINNM